MAVHKLLGFSGSVIGSTGPGPAPHGLGPGLAAIPWWGGVGGSWRAVLALLANGAAVPLPEAPCHGRFVAAAGRM